MNIWTGMGFIVVLIGTVSATIGLGFVTVINYNAGHLALAFFCGVMFFLLLSLIFFGIGEFIDVYRKRKNSKSMK